MNYCDEPHVLHNLYLHNIISTMHNLTFIYLVKKYSLILHSIKNQNYANNVLWDIYNTAFI